MEKISERLNKVVFQLQWLLRTPKQKYLYLWNAAIKPILTFKKQFQSKQVIRIDSKKGLIKMKTLQKFGGFAALIGAATNLLALVVFLAILAPTGYGSDDPGQVVAFLADNQAFIRVWYLIIYLLFGVSMIFLALALNERLKAGSPALAQAGDHLRIDLGRPDHCERHTLNQQREHSRQTLWRKSGSSCNGLVDARLCGNRFGRKRRGNDGFRLVASTARLGNFAGKGTSQGIELPWRGDRYSRHPLGCP
jgi:hypothetical protein